MDRQLEAARRDLSVRPGEEGGRLALINQRRRAGLLTDGTIGVVAYLGDVDACLLVDKVPRRPSLPILEGILANMPGRDLACLIAAAVRFQVKDGCQGSCCKPGEDACSKAAEDLAFIESCAVALEKGGCEALERLGVWSASFSDGYPRFEDLDSTRTLFRGRPTFVYLKAPWFYNLDAAFEMARQGFEGLRSKHSKDGDWPMARLIGQWTKLVDYSEGENLTLMSQRRRERRSLIAGLAANKMLGLSP